MRKFGWLALALLAWQQSWALEPEEYAFQVSAQAAYSPPRLILNWVDNPARQIQVRRKLPEDGAWGGVLATLPANTTTFTDGNVALGKVYEYQLTGVIADLPTPQSAYGYIAAGIEVPVPESRGKVILVVDRTHADALAGELAVLRQDLIGDGWTVARRDVWPTDSVPQVKGLIQAEFLADPNNTRAVFLIGHVPVPYSGLINPDMHPNHLGAWPADAYYGDMDGNWTDQSVNKSNSEYDSNNNVPGDGKFDQSVIPSAVELAVGRVDLWNLPAFAPRTERELLRNYLNKDHRFRHAQMSMPLRGLIRDQFREISGDAPALDGWRTFPALFGPGNIREVGANQFFPTLANEAFLWAYAGGGGDFHRADGVGRTIDFAANDPRAVFLLLHGSYFGDWNNENNFLRAALATPNYSLVSIWSSLPHWYFQHLALGETIGYATRLTQNNRGLYRSNVDYSFGQAHISMLGDPTLRPFVIPPPSNLRMTVGARLTLSWDDVAVANAGFHVYRAASADGPFVRLNRGVVTTTSYEHALPAPGNYVYMVRTAALQTTGSGSFQNLSQGIFLNHAQTGTQTPQVNVAAIDSQGDESGNFIVFQFTRDVNLASSLVVNVQYSGQATAGSDYANQPATVSFSAGEIEKKITIHPLNDGLSEAAETITVTIVDASHYTVGSGRSATGVIAENGESRILATSLSPAAEFAFTASGFANRPCRIESRSPAGTWRTRANMVGSATGSVTYRETIPAGSGAELYRVVWE